jgi:HSP20 family protein
MWGSSLFADPWSEFRRISQQMDSLFNQLTRSYGVPSANDQVQRGGSQQGALQPATFNWSPVCNFVEKDNEFLVEAELPGLSKDQVNVEVVGDTLRISGESKQERKEDKDRYHLYERSYGSFSRSMRLPENAQKDKINGEFKDGLLKLHIGKTAGGSSTQAKRIQLQ